MAAASAGSAQAMLYSAPWALTCWRRSPCAAATRRQGADLIDDEVLDLSRGATHLAPAEAGEILEPGMGADGHAVGPGELDRPAHDAGVARMEAAGDVGRRDHLHQRLVVAQAPGAEGLADIGVEINSHFVLDRLIWSD